MNKRFPIVEFTFGEKKSISDKCHKKNKLRFCCEEGEAISDRLIRGSLQEKGRHETQNNGEEPVRSGTTSHTGRKTSGKDPEANELGMIETLKRQIVRL